MLSPGNFSLVPQMRPRTIGAESLLLSGNAVKLSENFLSKVQSSRKMLNIPENIKNKEKSLCFMHNCF